jgi:hypothetical protein
MFRHELAVEQPVPAHLHPRHQPGQRHLRGIGAEREHALAEEGAAELHSIKAADQFLLMPAFDRVSVAEPVQL